MNICHHLHSIKKLKKYTKIELIKQKLENSNDLFVSWLRKAFLVNLKLLSLRLSLINRKTNRKQKVSTNNLSNIPKVTFTRLLGFIDILNHMGGKADVAAISSKEQLELDDILPILETGRMLGLIEVKSGDVSITQRGHSLLSASSPRQQKIMLRQMLTNLKPFRKLLDLIKQSKDGCITKQQLLEYYSSSRSSDSSDSDGYSDDNDDSYYDLANNFDRIIGWGRMALLIDYNSDNETIRLRND